MGEQPSYQVSVRINKSGMLLSSKMHKSLSKLQFMLLIIWQIMEINELSFRDIGFSEKKSSMLSKFEDE